MNIIQQTKKIQNINEEEIFLIKADEETEKTVIANDSKIQLYKRIQKLDEQTKEVVYLRITGELSFKEIGNILNKTENWARVTFYRGKQKLKEVEENEREKRL